jgi:DNA-binding transcriptional MerR regulator
MTSKKPTAKKWFKIGEVSQMTGLPPSVLRFWEEEFQELTPAKTGGGTRKYTQKDIDIIQEIQLLTREKGFTLDGAKAILKQRDVDSVHPHQQMIRKLKQIKHYLEELRNSLD